MGRLREVVGILAILAVGGVGGFLAGQWSGAADLRALFDLPLGGYYIAASQQAVFQKTGERQVSWLRVPRPWEAKVMQLFPPPVTTSTTLPDKERK